MLDEILKNKRLTGLLESIGEEHIYRSLDAAVQAFEARLVQETIPPETPAGSAT